MTAQLEILISFLVFVVAFVIVGLIAASRTQNTEADYILGGRSLGPILVGLSAGATGNSGFIMFGGVAFGYNYGLSGLLLPLGVSLGELIYWNFFPARVNRASVRNDSSTVPQLIAEYLPSGGRTVRLVLAILILVLIGAYCSAQFVAAGKAIQQGFDIDPGLGVLIGSAIILLYCTGGGFRASVWTDLVQAGVVIVVAVGVLTWVTTLVGGPGHAWRGLAELGEAGIWGDLTPSVGAGLLFLGGFTVFGFGFSLSQPQLLVRVFAARDEAAAAKAKWAYMGFVYTSFFAMVTFGAVLRLYVSTLQDPEQGLLVFANSALSPWLVGLIVAGIFSAIASTADSQMLVLSNTLQHDLFPRLAERLPKLLSRFYLYLVTVITGVIITGLAMVNSATIFQIVVFSIAILASTLGPTMLLLLLDKPLTARGVLAAVILGGGVSVAWAASGLGAQVNEAAPGFAAGLIGHLLFLERKGR